jgi:ubiquinone/menaquinone biosynthesis C-methylase UbiE
MKSITFDGLKQIVDANGKLDGWNFSHVRAWHDPVLWDYVDVVRQYIKPSDRVLDIGTGGGEIFFTLASYFGEGVGIDQNPAMIETARRNQSALSIDNISLVRMDGSDLRFEAGEFDVVLLRHLRVYASEIVRVLHPRRLFHRPNGRAAQFTQYSQCFRVGAEQFRGRLVAAGRRSG